MGHYKSKTMKHEHSKSQQVKTGQRFWPALIVASQATKPCRPGKTALHDPSAWQQDEAAFGLWQFDHLQAYSLLASSLSRLITGVALINKRQLDMVARHFLDSGSQFAHLSAILLIRRGDMQRQQIPQGINCQMHFAALAPLSSIVARSMPAFGTRLQGSTIKNGCRWLCIAPLSQSQQGPQIVDDGPKDSRFQP